MQATLVAAVCAILSMLSPPLTLVLMYVSGGAIALVTLRVGGRQGLLVTAGAVLGAALIALAAMNAPMLGLTFTVMLWLPVWLASMVLRTTQSLALALQLSAALGVAAVLAVFLVLGDPTPLWLGLLEQLRPAFEQTQVFSDQEQLAEALRIAATLMTGSTAAYVVLGLILSLMLGRSWQALLFNPGGFGEEFRKLRYDRVTAVVALGVLGVAWFTDTPVALNVMIVLGLAYVFYGLAVVHGAVAKTGVSTMWLAGLYILMLLALPQVAAVLALVGFADTWFDFRARLGNKSK